MARAAPLRLDPPTPSPPKAARPPSGSDWVHEIKFDGYRLMVRRDYQRIRAFTKNGNDWADRFPAIVEAALRIKATSFLIHGEVVIFNSDGNHRPSGRCVPNAVAVTWCCMPSTCCSIDGADLRDLPLIERKWQLFKLIGKSKRRVASPVWPTFDRQRPHDLRPHVCRLGLEGIVSKRLDKSLPQRAIHDVAEDQEPGQRGGAAGA